MVKVSRGPRPVVSRGVGYLRNHRSREIPQDPNFIPIRRFNYPSVENLDEEKNKEEDNDQSDPSSFSSISISDISRQSVVTFNPSVTFQEISPPPSRNRFRSKKNERIVISNIRHFRILFWILAFCNAGMTLSFISIIYKISFANKNIFSVAKIRPYLLPSACVATTIPILHTVITCLRVLKFRSKFRQLTYQVSCVINLIHYVVLPIAVGTKLWLSLLKLKRGMLLDLDISLTKDITATFKATQMKRQCCGVDSFLDWVEDGSIKEDDSSHRPSFPESCCPAVVDKKDENICYVDKVWRTGCYDLEWQFICWYCGWFLALLPVGFIISAAMSIQVRRLYTYLQMYRPYWLGLDKPLYVKILKD